MTQAPDGKQTSTGVCTERVCLHRSPLESSRLRAGTPSCALNRSSMWSFMVLRMFLFHAPWAGTCEVDQISKASETAALGMEAKPCSAEHRAALLCQLLRTWCGPHVCQGPTENCHWERTPNHQHGVHSDLQHAVALVVKSTCCWKLVRVHTGGN